MGEGSATKRRAKRWGRVATSTVALLTMLGTSLAGLASTVYAAPPTFSPMEVNAPDGHSSEQFGVVSQGDVVLANGHNQSSFAAFGNFEVTESGNDNAHMHGEVVPTIDGKLTRLLATQFVGRGDFNMTEDHARLTDTSNLSLLSSGPLKVENAQSGTLQIAQQQGGQISDLQASKSSVSEYFTGLSGKVQSTNQCLAGMYDLDEVNQVDGELESWASDKPNWVDLSDMTGTMWAQHVENISSSSPLVIKVPAGATTIDDPFQGLQGQEQESGRAAYVLWDLSAVTGSVTFTKFYGAGGVYAPNANVTINMDTNLNGQIFAKDITLNAAFPGNEVHQINFKGELPCGQEEPPGDTEVVPVDPEVVQATCDADGNVVDPVVNATDTEGIAYTVEGDVKAGGTATVVATPADGYILGEADGWTLNEDGTASQEIQLKSTDCDEPATPEEVVPVQPEISGNECVDDQFQPPTVAPLADGNGIEYGAPSISDLDEGSGLYQVTATAKITADDTVWADDMGDGWTKVDETTATYAGSIKAELCKTPEVCEATIGDFVWEDLDSDGIQDPDEPGVEGVTVNLLDEDGKVVHTTKAKADGSYLFEDIECGTYVVEFIKPDGYAFTNPDQGNDDAVDSDADKSTGRTPDVTVDKNHPEDLTLDAGLVKVETPLDIIKPADPTVVQATCTDDGKPVKPAVTLPAADDRISYELSGKVTAGTTVTVTATITESGAFFPETLKGWKISSDRDSATKTVELGDINCDRPAPPSTGGTGAGAPVEGLPLVALAVAALVTGGLKRARSCSK